jgi:uncharacterized protein (TIGR02300 family)
VAKPDLGAKRQCLECGTKFFDFEKDPIVCPKCATVFQAAPLPRSPTSSAPAAAPDDAEAEAAVDLVPLEDADPVEEKSAIVDDDVEIEDEPAADDAFLEEEEGDSDDVTGLIDGDLEDDEES